MGDELLLRSRCPSGAGCFREGAEHVYLRERTVTPPRTGLRSSRSRRTSNRGHGVETVTISKTNTHSSTISTTSTASVEVTSMVTRRSARAGSAQPVAPAPAAPARASRRAERAGSTTSSERRLSSEYLAYSSDDEFEEFISQPKTDYTYARSVSYNTVSPQHVTPPNMSRRCLHSPGGPASLATGADRMDDRFNVTLSRDMRDFSYSREVTSRVTSSTTTATAKEPQAGDVAAASSSRTVLLGSSGADGDTSPHSDLSSSPPARVLHRPALNGSLYQLSRGLDVDSGDEDYVENNNVSKSSSYESHTINQEIRTSRRTISSVLLTVLYPFTYLWVAARDTGHRLVWRQRAAETTTAAPARALPPPGTVEYHRLMRGLPPLGTAGGEGRSQRQWARSTGQQTAARRSAVTTVTSTVTTVLTTVVTLLWWPVKQTASVASSAGRRSAGWARSVSEAADLPRRSAQVLHCLSPRTWARAAGSGAGRAAAALGRLSTRRPAAAGLQQSSGAHRGFTPLAWLRSACLTVLTAGQWAATASAQTVTGATGWTADTVRGAAGWTADTVRGAAGWTADTVSGAASSTATSLNSAAIGTAGVAKGTAGALGGAAAGTAGALSGAAKGTAGALSGAAKGTAGALSGAAKGTAGALSGAVKGTAGAVGGATKSLFSGLAASGSRVCSSVWPWEDPGAAVGRHGTALAAERAGRRRRLCLCLLPLLLLLLLLLLLPLLWGLYCEEDPAVVTATAGSQDSVLLGQLKAAPATVWVALRDTAAFVGTSTVGMASSAYGYLSLLGSSALVTAPPVSPAPGPAPAAPVVPVVPAVPAAAPAPPSESLTAVYARLEELQTRLETLQTGLQSCRAASEAAVQPSAVRAALGLGSGQLLTADQLSAAERRQADQLAAQLSAVQLQLERSGSEQRAAQAARRAELEARLAQLEASAGQLRQLQEDSGHSQQRAAGLQAELTHLQENFSELHFTLLAVQESLKQVRSCCNRTDPDWSVLLSQRLQSLESDLEGRLQGFATTIKQDLASESVTAAAAGPGGVSRDDVLLIAREALARYDADKTGKFDYALESAGGSVISTKCTESYNVKSARISVLGIPLWYPSNNPRTVIQPSVSPGECFAFRGQGYFVLALSRRVEPTEFVMEHIPRSLTPTSAIDSAPKNFTVLGLRDGSDQNGTVLGRYVYRESGPPLQEFTARPETGAIGAAFSVIELRVHNNWGHRDYTCLYRFRVHGRPVADEADVRGAADTAADSPDSR